MTILIPDIFSYPNKYIQSLEKDYKKECVPYIQKYLRDEDYLNPSSIHGPRHVLRVILNTYVLAKKRQLDERSRFIVLFAAIFHDIGRLHDGYCLKHGYWSWDKVQIFPEEWITFEIRGESYQFSEKERSVLQFIIENHCIPDEQAHDNLFTQFAKEQQDYVWPLYCLLKDADNLDRVRLGDLDIRYLRHTEALEQVDFAEWLYFNM